MYCDQIQFGLINISKDATRQPIFFKQANFLVDDLLVRNVTLLESIFAFRIIRTNALTTQQTEN